MNNRIVWPLLALAGLLVLTLSGCAGGALPPTSWAGLAVHDGVAYLATTDRVAALDTANGQPLWTPYKPQVVKPGLLGSATQPLPVEAQPAVYEELVFVGTNGQPQDEGRVLALDRATGQLRWQFPPESQPPIGNIFAGLVAEDGVVYLAATDQVYALNSRSGEKLWTAPAGGRVWARPTLAAGRLFVSTLEHKLVAFDTAEQGKPVWTFAQARGALAGSPVVDGDTVYVGSFDSRLYALDAADGQPRWSYNAGYWVWDGVAVFSDTVYVGDLGGYVQALKAQDGKPRWSQPTQVQGAVRANPVYVPAAEPSQTASLIVVTDAGNIYALDPGNGSIRWVANAPLARLLTPPAVDNGMLIVATLNGPVLVYGLDLAAMPEAYQQQEVKAATGRAPVMLYKENQVNTSVVRWSWASEGGK